MYKRAKLKAGVLSLVLGICLIITLITSALILLGYYYRIRHLNIKIRTELNHHLDSGEAWVLSDPYAFEYNNPTSINLFEDGTDSIRVKRIFWGLWDIYHLSSQKSKFTEYKRLAVGFRPDTIGSSALYLADDRRPISIAGDTKLVGSAYLPPSGIRTTYINRKGYIGDSLVYGKIKTSNENLPTLNASRIQEISTWLNKPSVSQEGTPGVSYIIDSISAKLQLAYKITKSIGPIDLSGVELSYEIIRSDTLILLDGQSKTDGTILIAPRIIIQSGFEGNLQAFAQDSLVVEDGVRLEYPSVLCVGSRSDTCHLRIGKSIVEGQIIMYGPGVEMRNKMIVLDKESLVNGLIYCDGLLNFEGKVIGHVATRKFYLRVNSSIFENHLLDAEIRQELGSSFLQSDLWGAKRQSGVLFYLNPHP